MVLFCGLTLRYHKTAHSKFAANSNVMSKMKFLASLLLILYSGYSFSSIRFPPESPIASEERYIEAGETVSVPKCKRWLVTDINKFGNDSWLVIKGKVEILPKNWDKKQSKYFDGEFTFKTGSGIAESMLVIYPESKVTFWSKGGLTGYNIVEYIWSFEEPCNEHS